MGEKSEGNSNTKIERSNYARIMKNIFGSKRAELEENDANFITDLEVYLNIAYMDRDKREMESLVKIWKEMFTLDSDNWVKNIAGREKEKVQSWENENEEENEMRELLGDDYDDLMELDDIYDGEDMAFFYE